MTTLLTEPAASIIVLLDGRGSATLSEIARACDRTVSTIQRAVGGLIDAGVVERQAPRGDLRLADGPPRRALRELAEWRLGPAETRRLTGRATGRSASRIVAPPTIHDDRIRAAWPQAIGAIVDTFEPSRIILFGSQAAGTAGPESDVDLLVIFDRPVDHRAEQIAIRRLLKDEPFAKDVLVRTIDDLTRVPRGTAVAAALRDGIVVYER